MKKAVRKKMPGEKVRKYYHGRKGKEREKRINGKLEAARK